jgi:glycosyltransferase involved in cell wall biosynthesis
VKIVFVSDAIYPYLTGGKEKRLYELSTRLSKLGHDVHIYTMHWWQTPETERTEDGVQLHALCRYHEMYTGDRRTIKEGVMFGLACLKLLTVNCDVMDVDHMPFFPVISAWIVRCLRGKKLHATWHEALTRQEWVDYMGPSGNIAAMIERLCIKLPHTITAASGRTQQLLSLKRNNVRLVTSGIDCKAVHAIEPAPLDCDVLAVCRLVKDKNIHLLIKAICTLAKATPNVTCTIVGKGPEKQRLMRQAHKLGLDTNITFIDQLPKASDVYAYMKAAKVFCLPTTREGFGIVTLEALGCGTPVVTTDSLTNASRSFINNGHNGAIVPLNEQAIAAAIRQWLTSGKPAAIAEKVAKYDWSLLAKQQAKVYAS